MTSFTKWFGTFAALSLVVGISPAYAKKKRPKKVETEQTTEAKATAPKEEPKPEFPKNEDPPPPAAPEENPQADAPSGGGGW